MTDNITVTSSLDAVTVVDPTLTTAVVIREDTVAAQSGVDGINIAQELDSLNIVDNSDIASFSDVGDVVAPNVGDVIVQVVEDASMPYAKRVDFVGDTTIYRGEAVVGASESDTAWRIRRITIASDDDVTEEWADGSASFNKAWDDRLTETYI